MSKVPSFVDLVEQVGACIRQAREIAELKEADLKGFDTQIEEALQLIDTHFKRDLQNFLDKAGVTDRLRVISGAVIKGLGEIDGYNVAPESGSITVIRSGVAHSQPLMPLASAAHLYFGIHSKQEHFDFILASLSREEIFEVIQLHHYFRNQPSNTKYRSEMASLHPTIKKAS